MACPDQTCKVIKFPRHLYDHLFNFVFVSSPLSSSSSSFPSSCFFCHFIHRWNFAKFCANALILSNLVLRPHRFLSSHICPLWTSFPRSLNFRPINSAQSTKPTPIVFCPLYHQLPLNVGLQARPSYGHTPPPHCIFDLSPPQSTERSCSIDASPLTTHSCAVAAVAAASAATCLCRLAYSCQPCLTISCAGRSLGFRPAIVVHCRHPLRRLCAIHARIAPHQPTRAANFLPGAALTQVASFFCHPASPHFGYMTFY